MIVGAAALAISTFLPFVEPVSALRMVEHNSLIQHDGWPLIALALGIAGSGYRASRGKPIEVLVPLVLCTIAAVLLIGDATDTDMRTLYPLQINGTHLSSDNRMAAAQSGWVGSSALALSAKTAAWLEDSRRLITRVGEHALSLHPDGIDFGATERDNAEKLHGVEPAAGGAAGSA